MFRRSRFSARPNVGAAGRTAAAVAASEETPAVSKDAGDAPKTASEGSTAASESDSKPAVAQSEKPATQGDGTDPSAEASSSSSVQRRKRFTVKPKVAPGRPSALARARKSPVKAASQTPVEAQDSTASEEPTPSSQTPGPEPSKGPLSPRNRRPSEENKQSKPQPKPSLVRSDCSEPPGVAPAEDAAGSQVKDVTFKVPDKVPPSLPDKEAFVISERAKALVSSKMRLSASPAAFTLSRLLNDRSDLQRLAKAQKLRDLMKKEVHKERRKRRENLRAKEFTLDPAKMTMRDLIHYLPLSNPMTTSLEEEPADENEITVVLSPERENSPERPQEPGPPSKAGSVSEDDDDEEEVAAAATEEEQEEALLVPQVKVAEDGSLIIDEESLTVEVQRAKGPNPANERDPIFERGSTTTYSSFRKGTYSKPWSSEETDMFFLAISMVGTDFSMICQLFPHRARSEIKNKFKKEERGNAWRIDKAFKDRQKLDIEYFSKLLEKILEVQKNRKKLNSLAEKNSPRKKKRKSKGKKAAEKLLSDVEEEEDDEDDMPDLEGEEEGEKENEDLCNDGGSPGPNPNRKRKRAHENSAATNEPNDKKNKADKGGEQEEACKPEDADPADSESAGPTGNANAREDAAIKPAKLSRGRAPKPVPQLVGRRAKKPPAPPRKPRDAASETGGGGAADENAEEQASEDASPARQCSKGKSASDGFSSEDEGAAVLPPRPTRYGRMPKPTKPLTYPARDNSPSAPEAMPSSPLGSPKKPTKPKSPGKKRKLPSKSSAAAAAAAHESKRPKLFTLRASRSEYSDEEETESQWEEEQQPECSSVREGSAFVPASLRSPHLLMSEVEEDVIDCLSSDYTISVAEDESYNEAAHTLLTIGNVTQFPENEVVQDHSTESTASEAQDHVVAESAATADPQEKVKDDEVPVKAGPAPPLPSAEHSEKMPPPTRKGRSSKVKPAPNLGQASRSNMAGRTAGSGSDKQVTGESTENILESEGSPPVQQSGEGSSPVAAPVKASPGSEEEPGTSEGVPSRQSRRGVKPQPNLTKATRSARSQPQATKEPLESSSGPSVAPDPSTPVHVLPVESSPAMSDETGEHRIAPETSPEPSETSEGTGETAAPHSGAAEISAGPGSDPDSASGEPHVSLREDSPQPPAKTRFQKVKAKPNLAQGARSSRSRPQVPKAPEEKVSISAPGAETHQGPAESTEKNVSATLAPDLKSPLDVESTEGPSTPAEKEGEETADTPPGAGSDPDLAPVVESHVGQKEDPPRPPTRSRFQKIKPKPNLAMASRSARPNPKVSSCDVTPSPEVHPVEPEAEPATIASPENAASASDSKPSCDAAAPPTTKEDLKGTDLGALGQADSSAAAAGESLVQEQAAATDSAPAEEPGSQEEGGEMSTLCQTRRREKVKPKPRLTGRSVLSKTAASEVPVAGQSIAEEAEASSDPSGQSPTEPTAAASLPEVEQKPEESSAGEQRTDVESDQGSTSEGSGRNLSLRRRFSKVKPNLGSFARKRSAGPQPGVSEPPLAGEHSQQVVPVSGSSQKTEAAQPELGQKSPESEIKADATQPAGSGRPSRAENIQSGDAVQQPSESSPPASQSESDNKPEPLKSSGKAPQASRGRLVKPKPNVALGRRAQQQKESQPKDAVPLSEVVDVPADGGEASQGHTDTRRPAEGSTEQPTHRESSDVEQPSKDDVSAPPAGCFTQIDPSSRLQEGQTSSALGGNQSQSGLKLFSDMLPQQVPSDADEPYFILSLTEVPLGEVAVVGGASEPPPPPPPPGPPGSSALQHVPLAETSDGSVAVGLRNVAEALRDSAASTDAASENPADSPAKGNEQHPSESKQQRRSQGAAKLPTQPRTSPEKRGSGKTLAEPGSSEQTKDADVAREEPEGGGSKVKAKAAVSRRNQKGAASTSKSVAPDPSGEAAPLEAPTGNIAGLRSSAEEAEAASSAPAGQTSSEPAWCTDELLDWQPSGSQESSCRTDEDEPTGVSQYFLSDIFTEVEHE
ncbi:uncharacterized protein LOC142890416 isoform X2 [Nelusetta ayraudi]|uniref:uncharacterized protein LOC142890416 isoform X2 n=1 Tax=Nelusetta ayraudi TaxID=303726 RepID=UPI003F6F1FCE